MKNEGKITLISIKQENVKRLFDEVLQWDFRKQKPSKDLIDQKMYVYSSGGVEGIVGYCTFKGFESANTVREIMELTNNRTGPIAREIGKYYGPNYGVGTQRCYAINLSDPVEFDRPLTLAQMREIDPEFIMSQYVKYIGEGEPLFDAIIEWNRVFALDGHPLGHNLDQEAEMIINKACRC